jgi:NADH dehydrogenase
MSDLLSCASPREHFDLPGLPQRVSEATQRLLDQIGTEVRTGAKVTQVTRDGLKLADGSFIASELVIWAAGVKAPAVLRQLDGLEINRINQLVVKQTLQTTRDPDILAIGDCAACPQPGTSNPVPPRAQAAHQQAAHMPARSSAGCAASRFAPIHTATSARWCRSADGQPSGI